MHRPLENVFKKWKTTKFRMNSAFTATCELTYEMRNWDCCTTSSDSLYVQELIRVPCCEVAGASIEILKSLLQLCLLPQRLKMIFQCGAIQSSLKFTNSKMQSKYILIVSTLLRLWRRRRMIGRSSLWFTDGQKSVEQPGERGRQGLGQNSNECNNSRWEFG